MIEAVSTGPQVLVDGSGGRIELWSGVMAGGSADLFTRLRQSVPWRQEHITLYGRTHPVPRLSAWYGDRGTAYSYSGIHHEPLGWTGDLLAVRAVVEGLLGRSHGERGPSAAALAGPNAVLVNLYRDGRDSNGWHADDEAELDPNAPIVSVSLGATRRFRLRPKRSRSGGNGVAAGDLAVNLADDTALIMYPPTQLHWVHQVPKTSATVGERINMTFRRVLVRAPSPGLTRSPAVVRPA